MKKTPGSIQKKTKKGALPLTKCKPVLGGLWGPYNWGSNFKGRGGEQQSAAEPENLAGNSKEGNMDYSRHRRLTRKKKHHAKVLTISGRYNLGGPEQLRGTGKGLEGGWGAGFGKVQTFW